MDKQLKHKNLIRGIPGCPPSTFKSIGTSGFRSVFEEIKHRRNFLPVALIDSSRVLKNGRPARECCIAFGLSLFASLDHLRKHVERVEQSSRNYRKRVGAYFVELHISDLDGLCNPANENGHFSFFEFDDFQAQAAVKCHEKLMP